LGFLQWGGWESIVVTLPNILQGLQRKILKDTLQQEGSHPPGWVPTVLDPKAKLPRCWTLGRDSST